MALIAVGAVILFALSTIANVAGDPSPPHSPSQEFEPEVDGFVPGPGLDLAAVEAACIHDGPPHGDVFPDALLDEIEPACPSSPTQGGGAASSSD